MEPEYSNEVEYSWKTFCYYENPHYLDIVEHMFRLITWDYRSDNWDDYIFASRFKRELKKFFHFPLSNLIPIFIWAIAFTMLRFIFEIYICQVIE